MRVATFAIRGNDLELIDKNINTGDLERAIDRVSLDAEGIHKLVLSRGLFLLKLPSNIGKFTRLKVLHIDACHRIENLEGIQACKQLEEVHASKCLKLKDINALEGLKIKKLDLSHDISLVSLGVLKSLNSIEELNLEGLPALQSDRSFVHLEKIKVLHL